MSPRVTAVRLGPYVAEARISGNIEIDGHQETIVIDHADLPLLRELIDHATNLRAERAVHPHVIRRGGE